MYPFKTLQVCTRHIDDVHEKVEKINVWIMAVYLEKLISLSVFSVLLVFQYFQFKWHERGFDCISFLALLTFNFT